MPCCPDWPEFAAAGPPVFAAAEENLGLPGPWPRPISTKRFRLRSARGGAKEELFRTEFPASLPGAPRPISHPSGRCNELPGQPPLPCPSLMGWAPRPSARAGLDYDATLLVEGRRRQRQKNRPDGPCRVGLDAGAWVCGASVARPRAVCNLHAGNRGDCLLSCGFRANCLALMSQWEKIGRRDCAGQRPIISSTRWIGLYFEGDQADRVNGQTVGPVRTYHEPDKVWRFVAT